MSALDSQCAILAGWAGGLGWYMVGRFIEANAVTLEVTADGIAATTPVPELWYWIATAACAEFGQC